MVMYEFPATGGNQRKKKNLSQNLKWQESTTYNALVEMAAENEED